jgi:predicted CXXCH cytochrome family protein
MRPFAEITLAIVLMAAPSIAQERCGECHATLRDARLRGPSELLRESVHAAPRVGCAGCHGGRAAEATTAAHDPAAGFVARPDLAVTSERCGACHADARFIRRASATLQVDQLSLFRADAHGHAVADGRVRAPSCATCHGAHDIRHVTDPTSPVHPARVADTCGRCHEGSTAIRGARPAAEPPSAWRGSVHGRARLERGDANAPTCASCHGAHGEFREAGGADARCGSCHRDESEAFTRSPHAAPFARLGFSGCVQCHGSHGVGEAGGALLGSGGSNVCARCHDGAQRALDTAARLDATRAAALRSIDDAAELLRRADRAGLSIPEAASKLEAARAAQQRLDVALHTLDAQVVGGAAREVTDAARDSQRATRRALGTRDRQRRAWLPAAGLLLTLAVLLALRARREADR